ncbi:hypothetical protein L873DRAFT_1685176, partial [Choiromyces venosus 120613-1]
KKNTLLESCWGFVDCTLKQIAQSIYGKESVYNMWKRMHCLTWKCQAIIVPDSIIAYLYELLEGYIHDSAIWREIRILEMLDTYTYSLNGSSLQVYSDPVYGINEYLISSFGGTAIAEYKQ